jgi:Protein of unknown function (DUF3574)
VSTHLSRDIRRNALHVRKLMRTPLVRRTLLGAVLLSGLMLFAQVRADTAARSTRGGSVVGNRVARTELFLGRAKPDGTTVTDAELQRFLDDEVAPRFPDGLTVLSGSGIFRGADGAVRHEGTSVLILLYPEGQRGSSRRIEEIRERYATTFRQESILRVDDTAVADF